MLIYAQMFSRWDAFFKFTFKDGPRQYMFINTDYIVAARPVRANADIDLGAEPCSYDVADGVEILLKDYGNVYIRVADFEKELKDLMK